ncbi:hypothetical protein WJX79_004971 [Trebouxia sp. C0005]
MTDVRSKLPDHADQHEVDVAVVGGGPGGLATAAAVLSAFGDTFKVKVYESLTEYTLQGSAVGLQPNAQYALEAIHPGLLARFKECGLPVKKPVTRYDLHGNFVDTMEDRQKQTQLLHAKYGKYPFILGWHEIRQLLFDYLPAGIVEFDKQMTKYDEVEDGVTIHFDRGHPSIRAKVLIGADGYFSRIRKQCLNDGPPLFAGCVMWRARIAAPEGRPEEFSTWREPNTPVMSGPFAMLIPMGTLEASKHKPWTWILGAPLSALKEAGVQFDPEARGLKAIQGDADSGSALENALKIFRKMPSALMDIVKGTDPTTVTQHGLYMRPLTDPSLHPLLAPNRGPLDKPPEQPVAPGTPPHEETAGPAVPAPTPPTLEGSSQMSKDISSSPMGAALGALSGSKAEGEPAASEGKFPASGGHPVGTGLNPQGGNLCTQPVGANSDPSQLWGRGRVTLLGDAAHATIPNGQGLALALEDAAVLGWHLKRQGLTQQALRSYERERPERVRTIHVKGSDSASYEERERYLYKPTFKPLWCDQDDQGDHDTSIMNFEP